MDTTVDIISLLANDNPPKVFVALILILNSVTILVWYCNVYYFSSRFYEKAKTLNTIFFCVFFDAFGIIFNEVIADTLSILKGLSIPGEYLMVSVLNLLSIMACVAGRYYFMHRNPKLTVNNLVFFKAYIITCLVISLSIKLFY